MTLLIKWLALKKRYVLVALLILIIVFLFFSHHSTKNNETLGVSRIVLSSDDLAFAKKENFTVKVPVSGELYPLYQTTVIAKVGGEAQAVYVREGESVKKNQLLVQLNTVDLLQTLKEKRAALASAEASYKFSNASAQRYKKLLEKKYYSQNDYDTAINQVQVTAANQKQAQAALSEAQLQLDYASVISSLDGIISERNVDPGMNVSVGQTLFKIVNLDRLELRAVVPADQISQIKIGQKADFEVDGISHAFVGKVVRINPSNVSGTRAYYAYIAVDNAENLLKNGMFATGGIILDEHPNTITIPLEAVRYDMKNGKKENNYIYVVDKEDKIQKKVIKTGLKDTSTNKIQVLSGIIQGELVIVSGVEIQEGSSVLLPVSFIIKSSK